MKIVTKEQINKYLFEYYKNNFGEKDTDIWHEQPAVNVWVFERDNQFISLKAHIITGEVREYIEEKGV